MKKLTLMAIALTALTLGAVMSTLKTSAQAPIIIENHSYGDNGNEQAFSIEESHDFNFIFVGRTDSGDFAPNGGYGLKTRKIKLNQKNSFGIGNYSSNDYFYSVIKSFNNSYVYCGSNTGYFDTTSNCIISKINWKGLLVWKKFIGGSGIDVAYSVKQTQDSGFIVAGSTNSNNGDISGLHGSNNDFLVVRLNKFGNIVWQKCLGGTGDDVARSIDLTYDGGYIITGYSNSNDFDVTNNHGNYDYWVVKIDSSGNIVWEKSFGGSLGDKSFEIRQCKDSGIIVTGTTFSSDGNLNVNYGSSDFWVLKLNKNGQITWSRSIGTSLEDCSYSIVERSDSSYVAVGFNTTPNKGRNYWLVGLSYSGKKLWGKSFGGSGDDIAYSANLTSVGDLLVAGKSNSIDGVVCGNRGAFDAWIVKLTFDTLPTNNRQLYINESLANIYPNPVNDYLTIKNQDNELISQVVICDILGHVLVENNQPTNADIKTDVSDFKPGIYFVKIQSDSGAITKKIIKE